MRLDRRDDAPAAAALGVGFVNAGPSALLALRPCFIFFGDGCAIDAASVVEGRGSGVQRTARKKTFMAKERETNALIPTKA